MRLAAALVVFAVLAAVVPIAPSTVERRYSSGVYPRMQASITRATNYVPIAIIDIAGAVLIAGLLSLFIRRARSVGVLRAVLRTAVTVVSCAAALYLLFVALWGLNYRRIPLEQKLDYEASRVTRAAAAALANAAAASMNRGYAAAHAQSPDLSSLARAFSAVQRSLGATDVAVAGVPKHSVLSWYFRRAALDGMTDPFFLEILVNPDLLDIERPFVIAHEWAHLAGYANEAEANFLAWLTCVRGDALAEYSGWVAAYQHAAGALPRADRRTLTALDPGPREDLGAIGERYSRSSPAVRRAAREIYDGYLRANRVPEGIDSYDAVLRLMLGTRFGADGAAKRR